MNNCAARSLFRVLEVAVLTVASANFAIPLAAQNAGDSVTKNNVWAQQLRASQVQKSALKLSRRAVTQFLQNGSTLRLSPEILATLPPALRHRAGVFVTIEKRGQITPRGCRGTLQPITSNLAEEIVRNSIAACLRDAHQPKLRRDELPQTLISLTIVVKVQPISSIARHDAANNGLIAQSGSSIGVVLPYEGHDAPTQLIWAKRKAGLPPNAAAQLSELFAVRFRE